MSIYEPAEDSFLLSGCVADFVKKNNPEKILDMGSGCGIQAEACINSGANPKKLTLIDINPEAIKLLKKKFQKSKVIQSNLFEKVPSKKFKLIIFNPPYLPKDANEPEDSQTATTGGKKGSEIINKFLIQAKKHLDKDGKILLLTSSLTKGIKWENWKKKLLRKKKLFFEQLSVFELSEKNFFDERLHEN